MLEAHDLLDDTVPQVECDVVIVGAGPSGLLAAALLGQRHKVIVVERHAKPYGLPRAGHIDHEILRILQGIEAHQPLLDDGMPIGVYRWLNGEGKELFSFLMPAHSLSGFMSDCMMFQPVLEDALRASIERCGANVTIMMGRDAGDIVMDDEGVLVSTVPSESGSEEGQVLVRGTYLLAADGSRSGVRTRLGIAQANLGFEEDWLDIDVRIREPLEEHSRYLNGLNGQFCDPARPTYIGSLGKGHHRFEFAKLENESWQDLQEPGFAWGLLQERGITSHEVDIFRQVVYRFEAKVADDWRHGRVFLLGDAAHTMPPHFGQGLCSAMRDSANICWKLDLVLRGTATEQLLDSYQSERYPHARGWVENSVAVGRISCTLDPEVAAQRDESILSGDVPFFPPPAIGAGIFQSSGPAEPTAAGDYSLQARVTQAATTGLLHDVVGHGFILLCRGDDPRATFSAEESAIIERLDVSVRWFSGTDPAALQDVDGAYGQWFADHGVDAVLIRPDYYVFGASSEPRAAGDLVRAAGDAIAEPGPSQSDRPGEGTRVPGEGVA